MEPQDEEKEEKLFYTIGEVAEMFQVNTSLVRFWESEINALKPRKSDKGKRLYTTKDIEVFRKVYHLVKEKGYTLQGANEALKNAKKSSQLGSNVEMIDTLKKVRDFLTDLKKSL